MLPFLAGLAVGTALTILYAKRDEVKKAVSSPEFKGKVEDTKRASIRAFDDVKDKAKQIFANLKGETPKNSKSAKSTAEKTPAKRGRKASAKSTTTTAKSVANKGTATKTTRAKRGTATTAKSATGTKTHTKRTTTTRTKQTTASAATNATNSSEKSVVSTSNADTNLI